MRGSGACVGECKAHGAGAQSTCCSNGRVNVGLVPVFHASKAIQFVALTVELCSRCQSWLRIAFC